MRKNYDEKILKLAFLGCGDIAQYHLAAIKNIPRVKITAVIDTDRQKAEYFAEITDAAVFFSFEDALKLGDFDAVDIMLPHDLHEKAALQAFSAHKHVLLEKPIAMSLEASARILDAAERSHIIFMVGENAQYWPEITEAKKLIDAGVIGEVVTANANFSIPLDAARKAKQWRNEKARTGGGIVIDGGSHWIRPLRMWMGEVEKVVATYSQIAETMEGESLCQATLKFTSGKTAQFSAVMVSPVPYHTNWWEIIGRKGVITIESGLEGKMLLVTEENPHPKQVMEIQGYKASFQYELADFVSAILDGKQLTGNAISAMHDLAIILAIYHSAENERWEPVNKKWLNLLDTKHFSPKKFPNHDEALIENLL